MAYAASNPPMCVVGGVAGSPKIWFYVSTDALSLVRVAGYFSNGYTLGMRKNDLVIVVDSDASPLAMSLTYVNNATSDSDVDCADGTALTATDSD